MTGSQCGNCQKFGYTAINCRMTPICNVCSQNHGTSTCKMEKNEENKCINCNGNHKASSRACSEYINYSQRINHNKETQQKRINQRINNLNIDVQRDYDWLPSTSRQHQLQQQQSQVKPTTRP